MKIVCESTQPAETPADVLVVFAFDEETQNAALRQVDTASDGMISKLAAQETFSSKEGNVAVFHCVPGIDASLLVIVGLGQADAFGEGEAFRFGGVASKTLADKPRGRVAMCVPECAAKIGAAAIAGFMNGGIGQDVLRAEKKLHAADELVVLGGSPSLVTRGQAIGQAMLLTRELVNLPANYVYPVSFTQRAASVAIAEGFELEVWDELRLRREGCGALLAVSAGSSKQPRLLVMRYRGTNGKPPLALVGKGVTFDSGGLSIKPSDGMLSMKCDMAGAATVLGAMQAIARLKVATPVVGLVGLVENMINGSCFKLGDVITARNGKTVEIHNTDAEGRLVLADTLDVALQEKPSAIVDLATLTGACVVALGKDISGLMSNNDALASSVQEAAKQAGEHVWPLPMLPHFDKEIESKVADIKNLGDGRWGGATTAAKFLEQFVGEVPWVHLDIAGPAFGDSAKPHLDAGASGAMVRTLLNLAESRV